MCNGIIILYLRMHYRRAYYIHACHMPHAAHMLSCHCIMHLHLLAVAAAQNSWNIRFACCDLRFMPPSRRASATPALCLVLAPRLCLWFVCAHIFHFVPIRFVFAKYQRIPRLQAVRPLTQYVPLLMPNVAGNTCTQLHVSTPIRSWVSVRVRRGAAHNHRDTLSGGRRGDSSSNLCCTVNFANL